MYTYLDYNSTTPVSKEVLDEMIPYFNQMYGNPSSTHTYGQKAIRAVDMARVRIAKFLGSKPDEIIFTGSGTESDNLAISGVLNNKKNKKHIITSSIEHSAVYNTCKEFEKNGFKVTYLPVDNNCRISIDDLENAITEDTALISIMLTNNETGVIQDIKKVAEVAEKNRITLHTDAVQAAGKMEFSVDGLGVDLLTISGHKIYGPKGIGALYVRRGLKLHPMIFGGGQEKKLRAGTENVPGIVGLGKACEIAGENLERNIEYLSKQRDALEQGILKNISFAKVNGGLAERGSNTSNISFPGIESETMIVKLDLNGIAVSSGSACGATSRETSRVLTAMGLSALDLFSVIRFSVGLGTTDEDIEKTVQTISKTCNK